MSDLPAPAMHFEGTCDGCAKHSVPCPWCYKAWHWKTYGEPETTKEIEAARKRRST